MFYSTLLSSAITLIDTLSTELYSGNRPTGFNHI